MSKKFQPVFVFNRAYTLAIIIFSAGIFFSSCKIYKPAYYFKDIKKDTIIAGFVNSNLELKIQKNDELTISISSLNPAEDALFNKASSGGGAAGGGASSGSGSSGGGSGFQVGNDGNIYLHKLGKINVAGLTRKELKAKLENELLPYLKDPIATVNFSNHKVTVLGEGSSRIIPMPEEKISLVDVMAMSGGGTQNSELNKIMIIRETNNTKEVKYLNLENPSIFTSPWYYLQPNDIVVVKPNEEKIDAEQKRTRNQLLYTTILSLTTFIFLILDRITR